jgi:hypothetical protein
MPLGLVVQVDMPVTEEVNMEKIKFKRPSDIVASSPLARSYKEAIEAVVAGTAWLTMDWGCICVNACLRDQGILVVGGFLGTNDGWVWVGDWWNIHIVPEILLGNLKEADNAYK